jgi:hypothetical protein
MSPAFFVKCPNWDNVFCAPNLPEKKRENFTPPDRFKSQPAQRLERERGRERERESQTESGREREREREEEGERERTRASERKRGSLR